MRQIHVPGFLWTILIAVAVILVQQYAPSPWGEVIVVVAFGIIKSLNLDAELAEIIINAGKEKTTMRSAGSELAQMAEVNDNKLQRWLVK